MCGTARDEPPTDLSRRIELATRKSPGSVDRITRSLVGRRLSLEQGEDSLGAVRRPAGHQSAVRVTQRLRRGHAGTFPHNRPGSPNVRDV